MVLADSAKEIPALDFLLGHARDFRETRELGEVPATITVLCHDSNGRIAAPGEAWEATDDISDVKLPRSRLIWAAAKDGYHVVHCERGGYGHRYDIIIARLDEGGQQIGPAWRAMSKTGALPDLAAFITALSADQMFVLK